MKTKSSTEAEPSHELSVKLTKMRHAKGVKVHNSKKTRVAAAKDKSVKSTLDQEAKANIDEGDAVAVHPAIAYINLWKNDHEAWKFSKLRQTVNYLMLVWAQLIFHMHQWLLKNMLNREKIPKSCFKILVQYMLEISGGARTQTIDKLRIIVSENDVTSSSRTKRAKKILIALGA